jgi:hypothetical protein
MIVRRRRETARVDTGVQWPDQALAAAASAAAAKTAWLLADEERWVHRRVETIELLDARELRRRTSVDFTLPRFPALGHAVGGVEYVPLSLVRKGVLTAFDLRDEAGASLPLLNRRQGAEIGGALLVQQAEVALEELGLGPLLPLVETALRELAGEDVQDASAPPGSPEAVQWEALVADPWVGPLLWDLDTQFVLFVPLARAAGVRRVVKFEYRQLIERRGGEGAGRAEAMLVSLGVRPYRWAAAVTTLDDSDSYHVEVVAPPELSIRRAALTTAEGDLLDEQVDVPRAHLYRAGPGGGTTGTVDLRFALRRAVIWPVFFTTLAVTAILAAGLVAHVGWGLRADRGGAAGLVVALPALFAPFVAPGSHGLVRRMFLGLRVLALTAGVISFAAAATLQLTLSASTTTWIWLGLLVAASGATAIAAVAVVLGAAGERVPSGRWVH